MRKYLCMSVAFLACLFSLIAINPSLTEARTYAIVNGIYCVDGDLNYPIWDSGSGGGSATDVNSAFIREETSEYVDVESLNFLVLYNEGTMTQRDENCIFRYNKRTGAVAYYDSSRHRFSTLSYDRFLKSAFSLISQRLGIKGSAAQVSDKVGDTNSSTASKGQGIQRVKSLIGNRPQSYVTKDDNGGKLVFFSGGNKVLVLSKGQQIAELVPRYADHTNEVELCKATVPGTIKTVWFVYQHYGVKSYDAGLWIIGQQDNGKVVVFASPSTFDQLGYDCEAGDAHRMEVKLKGDKIVVTGHRQIMGEYGYQRTWETDFQAEMFWDAKADWFGIQRTI